MSTLHEVIYDHMILLKKRMKQEAGRIEAGRKSSEIMCLIC